MLNGSPTGFSHSNGGIRQGNPLPPYLFVILMEFLSISMELSLALGKYATIRRDPHNYVTHLLFADDMLVFSKANKASLKEIKIMLEKMKHYTGLSVIQPKVKFSLVKGVQTRRN